MRHPVLAVVTMTAFVLISGCGQIPGLHKPPAPRPITAEELVGYYECSTPESDGGVTFFEFTADGTMRAGKRWGKSVLASSSKYTISGRTISQPVDVSIEINGRKVEEKSVKVCEVSDNGAVVDTGGRRHDRTPKPDTLDKGG